jgi:hypothetical protein
MSLNIEGADPNLDDVEFGTADNDEEFDFSELDAILAELLGASPREEEVPEYTESEVRQGMQNAIRAAVILMWDEGYLQGRPLAAAVTLGAVEPQAILEASLKIDREAFLTAAQAAIDAEAAALDAHEA